MIRVLWIVNMILPELAMHIGKATGPSGSWMEDLSQKVSRNEEIELAVAAVGGEEYKEISINNICYFMLPGNGKTMLFYNKRLIKYWSKIYEKFKPDIVHIHGTEYNHGLSFLRTFPDVKSVVSIQGLLARIKDVQFDGMPTFSAIKYRTFMENIKLNGMLESSLLYKLNSKYEREILNRVRYANCVNTWDTSLVKSINPEIHCFRIEYNLREPCYTSLKWQIDKIERFSIFTNPVSSPIKGLHILLKALSIVKRDIDNVKLYIPGVSDNNGKIAVINGYTKYISRLLNELGLANNVEFIGRLNSGQMVDRMLKSHTMVIPSAIEGTSLMLREAMFLGVPSIASFRGGMADFIRDKESGFLYDFQEYPYLAGRMLELFRDDELALKFSRKGVEQAEKAHDRKKNPVDCINMYKYIYEN